MAAFFNRETFHNFLLKLGPYPENVVKSHYYWAINEVVFDRSISKNNFKQLQYKK